MKNLNGGQHESPHGKSNVEIRDLRMIGIVVSLIAVLLIVAVSLSPSNSQ
jgi:hypothetical protein